MILPSDPVVGVFGAPNNDLTALANPVVLGVRREESGAKGWVITGSLPWNPKRILPDPFGEFWMVDCCLGTRAVPKTGGSAGAPRLTAATRVCGSAAGVCRG